MNIIDILLQLINYIAQNFLLPILPVSVALYPLETLKNDLAGLAVTMEAAFGGWGVLFPVGLALLVISIIVTAEITLFGFKIIKYIIEIFTKH
jgi:hypothetical protein